MPSLTWAEVVSDWGPLIFQKLNTPKIGLNDPSSDSRGLKGVLMADQRPQSA